MYVFPFAVNGDQLHYIKFYDELPNLSFLEAYIAQNNMLSSLEPGYLFVTYIASSFLGLDRQIFFSIINSTIAYLVAFWMVKNRVSIIVFLLTAVNFYVLVLFFSADRLKLAFLFFVLYLLTTNKYKFVFFLMSMFTHVQMVVFLISKFALNFFLGLRGIRESLINSSVSTILARFYAIFDQNAVKTRIFTSKPTNFVNFGHTTLCLSCHIRLRFK